MRLVAKVFNLEITDADVFGESAKLIGKDSALAQQHALNRLIDRCLLFYQALQSGIGVNDDEFDTALLEALDESDEINLTTEQTRQLEERIRRKIMIRKYVQQICGREIQIAEDKLLAFYEDQKEVFSAPEMVRASHILIRADEPEAQNKALQIRAKIITPQDFTDICSSCSQCPTGVRCGDLGFFPKGRMIKEIEEVAFALEVNQISEVFQSRFGYHILMITDKKTGGSVPYNEIKQSLRARLIQLEREYFLIRHVNELRRLHKDQIIIIDGSFKQAQSS